MDYFWVAVVAFAAGVVSCWFGRTRMINKLKAERDQLKASALSVINRL